MDAVQRIGVLLFDLRDFLFDDGAGLGRGLGQIRCQLGLQGIDLLAQTAELLQQLAA